MIVLLTCLAGGLGAVARASVDAAFKARTPAVQAMLPWLSTLVINVLGAFILGCATGGLSGLWLSAVGTGFCGGFTTFSTASWQVARLLGRRRIGVAVSYLLLTLACCLLAAWLGLLLFG